MNWLKFCEKLKLKWYEKAARSDPKKKACTAILGERTTKRIIPKRLKLWHLGASILIIVVLVILTEVFDVFETNNNHYIYHEGIQQVSPVVFETATPTFWESRKWLTSIEVADLRENINSVNLVYLQDGIARYHPTYSASTDEGWKVIKQEFGIDAVSVEGTSVTLEAFGDRYILNVNQPFVLADRSETIYLINHGGELVSIPFNTGELEELTTVVGRLEITIEENPNLTPTDIGGN